MEQQLLDPGMISPSELALTNVVTGCTILFNQSLLNLAMPLPPQALVHDWWLALVASAFGVIGYTKHPSILYRQHQTNTIGAHELNFNYWHERFRQWIWKPQSGGHSLQAVRQIEYFERRYEISISELPALIRLGRLNRIKILMQLGSSRWPRKHGLIRTMAFYFWLLRMRAVSWICLTSCTCACLFLFHFVPLNESDCDWC